MAAYISVLYIAGLACFTLYPLPTGTEGPGITYGIEPQFDPLNFIYDIQKEGLKAVFQTLFNVVLFLPLGFIAKRFLRLGLPATFALSLVATLLIETAQLTGLFGIYPFAYRTFEVDDIITNTLGGILGWFLGKLFGKIWDGGEDGKPKEVEISKHPGFIRRCVTLWIDSMIMGIAFLGCWIVFSTGVEVLFGNALRDAGLEFPQVSGTIAIIFMLGVFALMEVVVPWLNDGSTLGGMFTHMTIESKERTLPWRCLFYALRSFILAIFFAFPYFAGFVLAIFYLIARKMPYDFLP